MQQKSFERPLSVMLVEKRLDAFYIKANKVKVLLQDFIWILPERWV
jgi:hypothetical protein